uniref:Zinc finger CCCH-type containing 7A n=1 Tax=Oncorhynchus kisutch TaxID=8019 RepID=A0A8C7FYX0_ONCKI
MSILCQDRSSRWQDIQNGLQFIHPCTQGMQIGNDVFNEGEWMRSIEMYTEALSIAEYADSEDISVPTGTLEKLYANRAAAYLNVGLHDEALVDCEKALQLNEGNHRALYRKARALKEMGRHKEAYETVAKCSLAVPQDPNVIGLTQDLAKMLGLKIRKAYVRSKVRVYCVEYELWHIGYFKAESPPVSIIPSVSPVEVHTPEPNHVPVPLPVPISKPMPMHTLVNGARASPTQSYHLPMQKSQPDFDAEIIGDDLDDLLDQAGPGHTESPMVRSWEIAANVGIKIFFFFCTFNFSLKKSVFLTDHDKPMGMALGMPDVTPLPAVVDLAKNPLADTHEFKQACSNCYVKTGLGVLDFTLYTEEHKCKKDILLGRIKNQPDKSWKLIRPRPTKSQYVGPYYICKDVAIGEGCRYPGHCTFAYCQEEIDVWSLERKGFICRDFLFDPFGPTSKINLTVPKILQEHHGIFMFLCGVCFDHKPRIISKANKDNPSLCSHPVTKHAFEDQKCLVHILRENTVRYSKIRPYSPQNQMDICRHEVRYGCVREDECFYAHSLIELKVWMMQHQLGITPENIVHEANRFWNMEAGTQGSLQFTTPLKRFGPPNLKMQFVCGQCWRNGQVSEADKNKKYCTAKARHSWSKDKRVVLVSSIERKKWTTIRPLPTKKPIPSQFEICMHVSIGKKCQYIGNCTFAHSTEERDLWTYMKENNIPDMEQLYEHWLQSQKPGWSEEASNSSIKENGKQIHMPTDYAEEMTGNHCWLCGKNCNSDRQWQQHITSEKHREKVFNSEDDQNCWQYRFPTGTFRVCERYLKGTCTEEELCKLAHGNEELREWTERREFLLMKLAKARKDHLIAPNDNDFGKYSFLLKDIK